MKRFRTITALCLAAIAIMVAANVHYMWGLYNSIKAQTLGTVAECTRRADILEIISRLKTAMPEGDESFIRMTLIVEGERNADGAYDYHHLLDKLGRTMSGYFHIIEQADSLVPQRNYAVLDSIFGRELNLAGIYPEVATMRPGPLPDGLWAVEIDLPSEAEISAHFSPLQGHILSQMAGIVASSAAILLLCAFLIRYLLWQVGRLRTIEQMKDDFTHNMTHELKTPVAVAYSAADSMLRYYEQSDEARNKQFLRIILQRLSYLSGMIENILSMSMERFKAIKLNVSAVELLPLVKDVCAMMQLKASKPVRFSVDVAAGLCVAADATHLANVLANLIDNAIKYSGSEVEIAISADEGMISVADNGTGIDRRHLPFIFDKFYRAHTGDRYETGGYGLGLFYVKQIINLMHWRIAVTSTPGQGSQFTILFNGNEK